MDQDARDKELLCLLDENARRPLSHLKEYLRISKQAIGQRIAKLRSSGIVSSQPLLNPFSFSRVYGRVWVRTDGKMNFGQSKEFIEMEQLVGGQDFMIAYSAETMAEFKAMGERILDKIGVKNREYSIVIRETSYPFRLFLDADELEKGKTKIAETVFRERKNAVLDSTDWKVLRTLGTGADESVAKLAGIARIDEKTFYYRMKKLESDGVIGGYRAGINHGALGLARFWMGLELRGDAREKELVAKTIGGMGEVLRVSECVGKSDLEIEFVVGQGKAYEFVEKMKAANPERIKDYWIAESRGGLGGVGLRGHAPLG